MKFLILFLLTTFAFASEDFGGIHFHSQINKKQKSYLKSDLEYLYSHQYKNSERDFLELLNVSTASGQIFHNWILNRVHYILPEDFSLDQNAIFDSYNQSSDLGILMSNLSPRIYKIAKDRNSRIGINFNGQKVFFDSPRVGVLKIGSALFDSSNQLGKSFSSEADTINRLGTLLHEARHSDGHGKDVGFTHVPCPVGNPYEGSSACEASGNGAYTLQAYAIKHFLKNCTSCSSLEKDLLEAIVSDAFTRIIGVQDIQISEIQNSIQYYQKILYSYQDGLQKSNDEVLKKRYSAEIQKIKQKLKEMQLEIEELKASDKSVITINEAPEGKWRPVSLKESTRLMEKSLHAE